MSESPGMEEVDLQMLVRDIATPRMKDKAIQGERGEEAVEVVSNLNIELGKLNPHEQGSQQVEEEQSHRPSVVSEGDYWAETKVESKWNVALQNEKKGRFSQQQQLILTKAVGEFLAFSEITFDQFRIILNERNIVNDILKRYNFFNMLANLLPNRTAQSCYRFLKRIFSNAAKRGRWSTDEEERLLEWVEREGRDWVLIGKMMGRTSDNVYDKYRSMGEKNASKRKKSIWTLKEIVTLLREVDSRAHPSFLDIAIVKELLDELKHNTLDRIDHHKASYNTTKFQFHNTEVVLKYVSPAIKEIGLDKISWSAIAAKLKTRSFIDCKNKFMQILEVVFKRENTDLGKIVQFLIDQGVSEEREVDWLRWNGEISAQQAKNRFSILKKLIPSKTIKQFATLLDQLRTKMLLRGPK